MALQTALLGATSLHTRLDELLASHPIENGPWVGTLTMTDDIQAFVILHPPGTPNDTHYHEHDEWWVVMRGACDWHIEGEAEPIHARAGDFVICPKFRNHHIEPVGTEMSVRVAINARGEYHHHDRPGCRAEPWSLQAP